MEKLNKELKKLHDKFIRELYKEYKCSEEKTDIKLESSKGCFKPIRTAQDIEYMLMDYSEGDYDTFKQKCNEKWVSLDWFIKKINNKYDSCENMDYEDALDFVLKLLKDEVG